MRSSCKWLCSRVTVLAGVLCLSSLVVAPAKAQGVGSTAEAAGIVFETLSSEDLDAVEQQVGYRAGVYVADVKAGSAAAAAGIKMRDIIIIIGETGVDSAEAAAAAINSASGTVEVMAFTETEEGYDSTTYSLNLSGGTSPTGGVSPQPPSIGWQLQSLDNEALDKIKEATGHRVGVLVTQVDLGSAAAQAGIQANDILLVVGHTGVDSPQAVEEALARRSGSVELLAMRPGRAGVGDALAPQEGIMLGIIGAMAMNTRSRDGFVAVLGGYLRGKREAARDQWERERWLRDMGLWEEDKFEPVQCSITLPTGTVPTGAITPTGVAQGDPVSAYFEMMDFIRTEAWSRRVTTSGAERQRVAALLEQDRGQMGAEALEAIAQLPQTWAGLQKAWAGASNEKKAAQRDYWRKQLLVPSQLFIPPEGQETFRGSSDRVVFNYPAGWIVAQTEDEGTQYLYLGPPGTEATWDQVINPSASPPGALFAVMPIDEEMKRINTYLDGARFFAERYVTSGAAGFKEIDALELGQDGAIITLLGCFPGEKEDKFFWVGCVRYGPDYILAGRLGGPTAQAETLVPAFGNALTTMELNPPGGGDDYGSAMVDYYAAKAGSIATSGPW